MSEAEPNADSNAEPSSGEASASPPEPTRPSYAPLFLKGCGFSLLAIVLGVGVLIASKGDSAAFGSALVGVVFLLLILGSSGLTGFWDNKS